MGVEDPTDVSDDESDEDTLRVVPKTATIGCQTPKSWAVFSQAQERKEAERDGAARRKRALDIGVTTPNSKVRAACECWRVPRPN